MKTRGVVFNRLRKTGVVRGLQRLFKRLARIVVLAHLEQDVAFQLQVATHPGGVITLLRDRVLLRHFSQRLVKLACVKRDHHLSKQRGTSLTIGTSFFSHLLQLGLRFARVPFVSQSSGDSEMRVDKVWLDRERFVVLRDGLVKPSHLQ